MITDYILLPAHVKVSGLFGITSTIFHNSNIWKQIMIQGSTRWFKTAHTQTSPKNMWKLNLSYQKRFLIQQCNWRLRKTQTDAWGHKAPRIACTMVHPDFSLIRHYNFKWKYSSIKLQKRADPTIITHHTAILVLTHLLFHLSRPTDSSVFRDKQGKYMIL
jgi:hypothetical protein